jgi:hypothetical protein
MGALRRFGIHREDLFTALALFQRLFQSAGRLCFIAFTFTLMSSLRFSPSRPLGVLLGS